jgi:hypothetical protein
MRLNPTSPLRNGFDYQDIWGLSFIGHWLKNPQQFKWLRFEALPIDDVGSDYFLDDIILCSADDRFAVYQAKHRQHPTTELWTWHELLDQEGGKRGPKQSLLQKWFGSLNKPELDGRIKEAAFITNAGCEDSIGILLRNEKIDIDAVRQQRPDIYKKLTTDLGNHEALRSFFGAFEFRFNRLSVEELDEEVQKLFLEDLRATREGFLNIQAQIRRESRRTTTYPITIDDVRKWCHFDKPRELSEGFCVPDDFEYFDNKVHSDLLVRLRGDTKGGVQIVTGKPGVGKSTYLSKLHSELERQGHFCIRHHYHISPAEDDESDRLQTDRVLESIKAICKKRGPELGELAHKDSQNVRVREFIGQLAKSLYSQGQTCILIIDGLDHVVRYGDVWELKRFLEEVCILQSGLWIILGTQEMAIEYLPYRVKAHAPRDKWLVVKGLSKNSTFRILLKNKIHLSLPKDGKLLGSICGALYSKTEGNPLHLRYCLSQLRQKTGQRAIDKNDVDQLIGYGGDIASYYSSLWETLGDSAKTIGITITLLDFMLTSKQLTELLPKILTHPTEISFGLRQVAHLLSFGRGGVRVYHNSFESFIAQQDEWAQQQEAILVTVAEWLQSSSYEYLKWSQLPRLKYKTGDIGVLLAFDREWLLESLCYPRNFEDISALLVLASDATFGSGQFSECLRLTLLQQYHENALRDAEPACEKLWMEALLSNHPSDLPIYFETLSPDQVCEYVVERVTHGESRGLISEAICLLDKRHKSARFTPRGEIGGDQVPRLPRAIVRLAAMDEQTNIGAVSKYIQSYRDMGWSEELASIYSQELLRQADPSKIVELMGTDLTPIERGRVLRNVLSHDIENKTDVHKIGAPVEMFDDFYVPVLRFLLGEKLTETPCMPKHALFREKVPEYQSAKKDERSEWYSGLFCIALLHGFDQHIDTLQTWMTGTNDSWSHRAACSIIRAAINIAEAYKQGQNIALNQLFREIAVIEKLDWSRNRESFEVQKAFTWAIGKILEVVRLVRLATGDAEQFDGSDVAVILSTEHFNSDDLLHYLRLTGEARLSKEAAEQWIKEEEQSWDRKQTYFSERAERYVDLARLCRLQQLPDLAKSLRKKAADNVVAYGSHKDMFWYEVLHAIKLCHRAGSKRTVDWIKAIASHVEWVTEYTDRDETGSFPDELAEIMAEVAPDILRSRYLTYAIGEKFDDAEYSFRKLLRSFDFESKIEKAIALTAVESGTYFELVECAEKKQGAADALKMLNRYFGYSRRKKSENAETKVSRPKEPAAEAGVRAAELASHLQSLEDRWAVRRFLDGWADSALSEKNNLRENAEALISALDLEGWMDAESELLDKLYPVVFQYNRERAFDILCRAQANGYGWSWYLTRTADADTRWRFIVNQFPDRYQEFFARSIRYSVERRYEEGGGRYFPLLRGVDFFLLFGQVEFCESIIDTAIAFGRALTADLDIPCAEWLTAPVSDDFEVLMQRLTDPSPFVRERAVTACSELLLAKEVQQETFERLRRWTVSQSLETRVVSGLLPFVRAAMIDGKCVGGLPLQSLIDMLGIRSLIIDLLVAELARLTGNEQLKMPTVSALAAIQSLDGQPTEFFLQNAKEYVGYWSWEKRTQPGRKFVREWSASASAILAQQSVPMNPGDFREYQVQNKNILWGMASQLSDVYDSAYLRTVDKYGRHGLIGEEMWRGYCLSTCPIDLSYWAVGLRGAPEWWPHAQAMTTDKMIAISYESQVEDLLNRANDRVILFMEGPLKPEQGWSDGTLNTAVTLTAFAYYSKGRATPTAHELLEFLLDEPSLIQIPGRGDDLGGLRNFNSLVPAHEEPRRLGDAIVVPLVFRVRNLAGMNWQWFRKYQPVLLTGQDISDDTVIGSDGDSWMQLNSSHEVATYYDWAEGLRDRVNCSEFLPYGRVLDAPREGLKNWLDSRGLRLAHAYKVEYRYKEYSWSDEYKPIVQERVLGLSNLIV